MTDSWQWFKSSKFAAWCDYCKREIQTTEGRWSLKQGDARYNACKDCMAPPKEEPRAGPPPLNPKSAVQPTIDGAACPQSPPPVQSSRAETTEERIERMHKQKMDMLALIVATLNERNRLLKEAHKLG